jgi:predicted RNase H-like HicB family nuclease
MELVNDPDEGGYVVSFPDLKGCITCADTPEAALQNAIDAKREWMITALEEGYPIPEPTNVEAYSGQFKLRIPRSLHKQLAEHASREGISMNQYCLYLLSMNDALASRANA